MIQMRRLSAGLGPLRRRELAVATEGLQAQSGKEARGRKGE
jgi:hypothetical protein